MLNLECGKRVELGRDVFIETETGRDGHAIYGPYQRIEPGRYVVVFTIELAGPCEGLDDRVCATVDVASHWGRLIYACRSVRVCELRDRRAGIALTFDLREAAELEFRVHVSGEAPLRIAEATDFFPLTAALGVLGPQRPFPDFAGGALPASLAYNPAGYRALYERGADLEVEDQHLFATASGVRVDVSDGDLSRAARSLWPHGMGIDVSYADAGEDVILLKALRDVSRDTGFYIDVGANDPEQISVTKLFYDRGWRGINIDPSPKWHARLVEARPRDINVQAAISDIPGEVTFFDHEAGGLGTIEQQFADRHSINQGADMKPITVKTMTLAALCDKHAPRDVHFLKIDVEGHEAGVLRSMDFRRFRPWLLCIEATEPMDVSKKTFQQWDAMVASAGYILARSDYLNRYYVAKERDHLLAQFATGPTGYISAVHD